MKAIYSIIIVDMPLSPQEQRTKCTEETGSIGKGKRYAFKAAIGISHLREKLNGLLIKQLSVPGFCC